MWSIVIKFVSKILASSEEIPKYQTKKGRNKRETQRGSRIPIILNDALTINNISSLAYVGTRSFQLTLFTFYIQRCSNF